jgi:hypothetical protein
MNYGDMGARVRENTAGGGGVPDSNYACRLTFKPLKVTLRSSQSIQDRRITVP